MSESIDFSAYAHAIRTTKRVADSADHFESAQQQMLYLDLSHALNHAQYLFENAHIEAIEIDIQDEAWTSPSINLSAISEDEVKSYSADSLGSYFKEEASFENISKAWDGLKRNLLLHLPEFDSIVRNSNKSFYKKLHSSNGELNHLQENDFSIVLYKKDLKNIVETIFPTFITGAVQAKNLSNSLIKNVAKTRKKKPAALKPDRF